MSTSFSVSDIVADVAKLAVVPTFTSQTNVTAAQVSYWVIQSARSLSAKFRQKFGEDAEYLRTNTVSAQAGLGSVSLPANTGEIHAVVWARTSSDWVLLERAPLDDLEDGQSGDLRNWSEYGPPRYRLVGETLALYPLPAKAETLVLLTTGHLNLNGETSFLSRLDADRWVTLDVAERVLVSQGRDASVLKQDKLMLEADLFAASRKRDVHGTSTIRDVTSRRARSSIRSRWSR